MTRSDIEPLLLQVTPIGPQVTVDQAADLFLDPRYERLLSIPVVDERGAPLGLVSRFQLNQIFLRRYGRELHGRHPVRDIMATAPLVIGIDAPLEKAAEYVTTHITGPLREDFIVTRAGRYEGMGVVLDLLRAMQARVALAFGQLQKSQAQLVQSEKMASLGQMVAGVAHEINTPLGYVRNNVELLAQVGAGDPELEALGRDTLFGLDQIRDLVVNLRNFSRLDQQRVAEVSVADCLDQTLVIAQHVLKDRARVVKRYGAVPRLRCSPSQINQVLLNVLTNAAQAIEHGEGCIALSTEHDGAWVRIGIQDNGKGIAPENLGKIFDPFFTTKPVGHGTGLGLSISYQIIEAHGGTIRVESELGVGTRFVISLPCESAPSILPIHPPEPAMASVAA